MNWLFIGNGLLFTVPMVLFYIEYIYNPGVPGKLTGLLNLTVLYVAFMYMYVLTFGSTLKSGD